MKSSKNKYVYTHIATSGISLLASLGGAFVLAGKFFDWVVIKQSLDNYSGGVLRVIEIVGLTAVMVVTLKSVAVSLFRDTHDKSPKKE